MDALKVNDVIERALRDKGQKLENKLGGKVIFIRAPMLSGIDDIVRQEIENIAPILKAGSKLIVVLETSGGSIEVVERLSDVFRHHFEYVAFVIPNFAYSAGTVLALSGNQIYMDYYSVLGPIDPQVENRDGRLVPGLGYLEKYKQLIDKSAGPEGLTAAETEFLITNFDPGSLFALEQAKLHSEDLIRRWLVEYKFKDWAVRSSSGKAVTPRMKAARALHIAKLLGDPLKWKSHGRGIPLRVLDSDPVKLKISNFGDDAELNEAIRGYYDLLIDYCGKIGEEVFIHTCERMLT